MKHDDRNGSQAPADRPFRVLVIAGGILLAIVSKLI